MHPSQELMAVLTRTLTGKLTLSVLARALTGKLTVESCDWNGF